MGCVWVLLFPQLPTVNTMQVNFTVSGLNHSTGLKLEFVPRHHNPPLGWVKCRELILVHWTQFSVFNKERILLLRSNLEWSLVALK